MRRIIVGILCVYFLVGAIGAENVDITNKQMRLALNERLGTFTIYSTDLGAKQIPLFDVQGNSDATAFFLKINDRVYRLRNEVGIQTEAYQTQGGAAIKYTIKRLAEVVIDFSFIETTLGLSADTFRIDVTVKNLTDDQQNFTVKGLFDTKLGESDSSFFSTAAQTGITSEYSITDMKKHQWIQVADFSNAMRFMLYGPGITAPRNVVVANKDVLMSNTAVWDTAYFPGRSFTSISSKNNAAVDIRWNTLQIQSGATSTISFYISLSAREQRASVARFSSPIATFDVREVMEPVIGPMVPIYENAAPYYPVPQGAYPQQTAVPPIGYPQQPAAPQNAYPQSAPQYQPAAPQNTYPQQPALPLNAYPQSVPQYQPAAPLNAYPQSAPQQPAAVPQNTYPPQLTVPQNAYPQQPAANEKKPIDLDYALDLFERVQQLSEGSGGANGVNRNEIKRLNAELDKFLNQIGQK
jgi:hypothetical protein